MLASGSRRLRPESGCGDGGPKRRVEVGRRSEILVPSCPLAEGSKGGGRSKEKEKEGAPHFRARRSNFSGRRLEAIFSLGSKLLRADHTPSIGTLPAAADVRSRDRTSGDAGAIM